MIFLQWFTIMVLQQAINNMTPALEHSKIYSYAFMHLQISFSPLSLYLMQALPTRQWTVHTMTTTPANPVTNPRRWW